MTEVSSGEVTERQTTGGDSSSALVYIKAVSSSSLQRQKKIIDLLNIQPGFSMEVSEQSPTNWLVEVELPTTGVLPTPVSSSSSERLDYSWDDDVDWDNVYSAPDTNKYSHLAEEEINVEEAPVNTSGVAGWSSHFEDLPSPTPQTSNISICLDIPIFLASLLILFS